MKFNLQVKIESGSELMKLLQESSLEISMPFLSENSDNTILELAGRITTLNDENSELQNNIRIVSEHNNFLSEKILSLMVPADVQPEPETQDKEQITDVISDNTAPDQEATAELHN